jgi:hypothetical protein
MSPLTKIILCGVALESGFFLFALQKDWSVRITLYLVLYGFLFMLMLAAWKTPAFSLPVMISFALLFRLTLLPIIPTLSDDIYRYGWEGRLPRQGQSPFRHPPEAPEIAHLRDAAWERINHKNISTVYPMLSQLAFRGGTYVTDGLRAMRSTSRNPDDRWLIWTDVVGQKIVFLFFDLATLFVVWKLMKVHGVDTRNVILYAWNPLVIIEIAGSGHQDSLGIFMLVFGVLTWETGHLLWAGLGLAASFLSKYLSALLIPKMILAGNWPMLGIWGSVAALGLLIVRPPIILVKGPATYATNWQFNGSIYTLLQSLWRGNGYGAKWTSMALGFGAMWIIAIQRPGIAETAFISMAVALFLAPTVHPWYLLWLAPFLCLFPNPAMILWNGTIALSYTVFARYRATQVWELSPMIQALEYAPVYLTLAWPWLARFI